MTKPISSMKFDFKIGSFFIDASRIHPYHVNLFATEDIEMESARTGMIAVFKYSETIDNWLVNNNTYWFYTFTHLSHVYHLYIRNDILTSRDKYDEHHFKQEMIHQSPKREH
jgi:hypothetical protein